MARKNLGKNQLKKEKIAIVAASGFVLAALTMTGLWMKGQNEVELDDGYTIDFEALEDSVENKSQEIAQNIVKDDTANQATEENNSTDKTESSTGKNNTKTDTKTEDKDTNKNNSNNNTKQETKSENAAQQNTDGSQEDSQNGNDGNNQNGSGQQADAGQDTALEAGTSQIINGPALSFTESQGLTRPVSGEVILPFSMESSIYFMTLDQYKYNPAMVISSEVGTSVLACANGQVSEIYDSRETGKTIVVDMGDGYSMVYGQLQDVCVTVGSYITEGSMIARVSDPSIYYSVEGTNLYLQLTKDGTPVNPDPLFK